MLIRLALLACAFGLALGLVVVGSGLAALGAERTVLGTLLTVCGGIGVVLSLTGLLGLARRRR